MSIDLRIHSSRMCHQEPKSSENKITSDYSLLNSPTTNRNPTNVVLTAWPVPVMAE